MDGIEMHPRNLDARLPNHPVAPRGTFLLSHTIASIQKTPYTSLIHPESIMSSNKPYIV